ncbi:MAG: DUF4097 family beta strand repeat protein [Clostridia bacterium]|nr:DUF4097 family beta strand repeat protein [Clostridia bacterium]
MKKFTGLWIAAVIILCIGISLTVAGTASGATRIIKNSGGFFERIGNFMESNILEHNQSSEIIDISDNTAEIKVININLEGYAVALKPTNKNDMSIRYKYATDNDHPNVNINTENRIMTIAGVNNDYALKNQVVEIFIPKKTSPEIIIESVNSAISVEELSLDSLTCSSNNAAISVEEVHCSKTVSLTTSNSLISIDEINADAITIKTDTGIINFDSLNFNNLDITNITGAINGELEDRSIYTVTTTRNGNTETVGAGNKTVNITNETGIINIEYND